MALALGFGKILVVGARMQDRVVAHELHVAGHKRHVQAQRAVVAQGIHQVERFDLQGCQARYLRKALRRFDVGAVIADEHAALVPVETRGHVIRLLAGRLLAAPIDAKRIAQRPRQVRPVRQDFVVHRGRTDDERVATRLRPAQAQEAHHIGGVVVERQAIARLVAARTEIGAPVGAEVAHMAQHIALRVLRESGAEVGADTPVDQRRIGLGVTRHGQATQQGEAAPAFKLLQDTRQFRRQARQREVTFAERRNADRARLHRCQCALQFGNVGQIELDDPVVAGRHVGTTPYRRIVDHPHFRHHAASV